MSNTNKKLDFYFKLCYTLYMSNHIKTKKTAKKATKKKIAPTTKSKIFDMFILA